MQPGIVRRTVRLACHVTAVAVLAACGSDWSSDADLSELETSAGLPGSPSGDSGDDSDWLVDRAADTGLDFVHFNGASGQMYFPEIMTGGAGLLDYDNDGDLDAYLVQGQMLGAGLTLDDALFPPRGPLPLKGRLYRNDLTMSGDVPPTLRFTDVTDESALDAQRYGMGVAAGDIDNDGWVDLYLTHYGPNQLFRNNGDGTFTDISDRSGTADPGWSVPATFVDYDRDGWLDLYVGNYVSYDVATSSTCMATGRTPDYCAPYVYPPESDHLYRNQGDGTFVDVTATALVGGEFGPALGVVTADFNGDGWIDIYVANDGEENLLWTNQGDGRFLNEAVLSGASVNAEGEREAGMGVVAGDLDGDGDEDLFVTHLSGETNTLYTNNGSGLFTDRSAVTGLGSPSLGLTGFGTAWIDIDNDGWLDSLVVNGAVGVTSNWFPENSPAEGATESPAVEPAEEPGAGDPDLYGQPNQLFRNMGGARFEDVTSRTGETFRLAEVSRAAAVGDVDNDGDADVLVSNTSGPARLFINEIGNRNHWLGLKLVGTSEVGGRDMLGARVEISQPGGRTLSRRVRTDGSYASANDPRVLVGLGTASEPVRVRVIWPDGSEHTWNGVEVDQWTSLQQGATP